MPTTTSKFGGTRIPFTSLETLPPIKINEVVAIHRDGSVRYFATGNAMKILADADVVGAVYNGVSGPTLPQVVLKDVFKFDATFQKCILTLRALLSRYVTRSFFNALTYRASDATLSQVGTYKTAWATEFSFRAAL